MAPKITVRFDNEDERDTFIQAVQDEGLSTQRWDDETTVLDEWIIQYQGKLCVTIGK